MALPLFGKRIAVIELNGVIGRGVRPETHVPLLERARNSRRFGALVLLVNSPGGSAAGSEELYLAVSKVAERKPVVSFIRSLGASGALYISSAAHKIVAVRGSMVGSIGVIFSRLVAEQALQKVGLGFSVQKSGAHKDMFSPWRAPTQEETDKIQGMMGIVYDRFIEVVAQGRKLDPARVRELATGEIFTAQQARESGLVDELGDLDTALDMAAGMAGIRRRVSYLKPRRRISPLLRALIPAEFAQELTDAVLQEAEMNMVGRLWL